MDFFPVVLGALAAAVTLKKNAKEKEREASLNEKNKKQSCTEAVHFLRGKSSGKDAWYFVLVPYDKIAYANSLDSPTTKDCEKLGRIIESGCGKDPPQEVLDRLSKEYDAEAAVDADATLTYVSDDIRLCTMQRAELEDCIGAYFLYHRNEQFHYLKLTEPFQSTLAYRAGLKNYDRIIELNRFNIETLNSDEFMERFEEERHLPVELLVCSPSTYAHYKSKKETIHVNLPTVKRLQPIRDVKTATASVNDNVAVKMPGHRNRYTDVNQETSTDENLKKPFVLPQRPVVPLSVAVKPLEKLVDSISDKSLNTLEKLKDAKNKLTNDEAAAIHLYSSQWSNGKSSLYELLNQALRTADHTLIEPYSDYLKLLITALQKLPRLEHRVWRGVNLDLSKQYQIDSVYVWHGFSSCTEMIHVTETFLNSNQAKTLFSIKCYDGRKIQDFSEFPSESEIVLCPGFRFRVKSIANPCPNFHIIDIEQIVSVESTRRDVSESSRPVANQMNLLWLDSSVNRSEGNINLQIILRQFDCAFRAFESIESFQTFLRDNHPDDQYVLIVSGQFGRDIVSILHDLPNLVGIYVYCMNKAANEKWANNYSKIKAVVTEQDELVKHLEKQLK